MVVAAVALAACSGNSDAPTARFEITQIPGEGAPGATFKGIGDFGAGEMTYTLFFGDTVVGDRLQLANGDAYTKGTGEDVWSRSSAGSDATTSFRNDLVASTDALEYLRSVTDEVTEVGAETVRGVDTTHYRGTVRLAEAGASRERDRYPVEVWVDENGRTRRYRSQTLGTEEILVWEFFDFGVEVDLSPPPPEKIK
ncbi:MAG TPA: hypothetical protein VGV93_10260 [Acidimicrobiales bacterium]|nr:hypothetical protein [Acidimicrobiales bacterium]